jgi:hypothetical protein
MAWAQQADSTDTDTPVIPPAPLIQKKNPNAISIPVADAAPKYQQQAAAATNIKIPSDSATSPKPDKSSPANTVVVGAVSTNARVGSSFGYRRDPFTRREKFHSGCDIKAHWGQSVGASLPGTVQFAGWSHGYGNVIIIEHGGGVATHYAHLSSFVVEPGEHVDRGSIIGYAGSTGRATSPHLHYEVRIDGSAVNPLDPLALDSSSDFFKNLAAVRIVQSAWPVETSQTKSESSKPAAAEPAHASQPKAGNTEHTESTPSKPGPDTKAVTPSPAKPTGSDTAAVSQERPRRVTPQ